MSAVGENIRIKLHTHSYVFQDDKRPTHSFTLYVDPEDLPRIKGIPVDLKAVNEEAWGSFRDKWAKKVMPREKDYSYESFLRQKSDLHKAQFSADKTEYDVAHEAKMRDAFATWDEAKKAVFDRLTATANELSDITQLHFVPCQTPEVVKRGAFFDTVGVKIEGKGVAPELLTRSNIAKMKGYGFVMDPSLLRMGLPVKGKCLEIETTQNRHIILEFNAMNTEDLGRLVTALNEHLPAGAPTKFERAVRGNGSFIKIDIETEAQASRTSREDAVMAITTLRKIGGWDIQYNGSQLDPAGFKDRRNATLSGSSAQR